MAGQPGRRSRTSRGSSRRPVLIDRVIGVEAPPVGDLGRPHNLPARLSCPLPAPSPKADTNPDLPIPLSLLTQIPVAATLEDRQRRLLVDVDAQEHAFAPRSVTIEL